jgi:hypothetical protein
MDLTHARSPNTLMKRMGVGRKPLLVVQCGGNPEGEKAEKEILEFYV